MRSAMCLKLSFTVELSSWTFTMQISLEFKATVCNFLMRFYRDQFWHKSSTFKSKSVLFTFQMFLSMKKFFKVIFGYILVLGRPLGTRIIMSLFKIFSSHLFEQFKFGLKNNFESLEGQHRLQCDQKRATSALCSGNKSPRTAINCVWC